MMLVALVLLAVHTASAADCGQNDSIALIVSYDGYYDADTRRGYLMARIGGGVGEGVSVEERRNALSDFDRIEYPLCLGSVVSVGGRVRAVHREQSIGGARRVMDVLEEEEEEEEGEAGVRHPSSSRRRAIPKASSGGTVDVTALMRARELWDRGYRGQGVRVGVFDTGLAASHPHFRHVVERTDWTSERTADDVLSGVGHGTFVAGVIAGVGARCAGFAPEAQLHIYKVFTNKQVSYTSWFLDAFNHAIMRGVHIINLSIGGPDFTDRPFMDKVWELTANGIILISAIGNDGPKFGTLNNPADQADVIGVGGASAEGRLARFSSRGMTTWELPEGYGRVKPDVVAYGVSLSGSSLDAGCRSLSGTSVASPVVAGAVALMLSGIDDRSVWTPSVVKQALIAGAERLNTASGIFEQGAGRVDLLKSFQFLRRYKPMISLFPAYLDQTECPYMWPYCSEPLYAGAIPTILNVTVLNGLGVSGRITDVTWEPFLLEQGDVLEVSASFSPSLWPWSGHVALCLSVKESASGFDGTAGGRVRVTAVSDYFGRRRQSSVSFPIRARIVPTPLRSQRIVWDQRRSLRYPPGYFPRDDLRAKSSPLDWLGDHPHTNYKQVQQHLRAGGYHLEISGQPLHCLNLSAYAAVVVVDPEEEFHPQEMEWLQEKVSEGLNLIVFAEWYNTTVMKKIRFMDENSKQWWYPETGGANVPALNALLAHWGLAMGDRVLDGRVRLGELVTRFESGTSVIKAPPGTLLAWANVTDVGEETLGGDEGGEKGVEGGPSTRLESHPVFALWPGEGGREEDEAAQHGFVAVFGDSSCLESKALETGDGCLGLLDSLLDAASYGISTAFRDAFIKGEVVLDESVTPLPKRVTDTNLARLSKVVKGWTPSGQPVFHPAGECTHNAQLPVNALANITLPSDLCEGRAGVDELAAVYAREVDSLHLMVPPVVEEDVGEPLWQPPADDSLPDTRIFWFCFCVLALLAYRVLPRRFLATTARLVTRLRRRLV